MCLPLILYLWWGAMAKAWYPIDRQPKARLDDDG